MPIVQPDYKGTTKKLTIDIETELLTKVSAYSSFCQASISTVAKTAIDRLLTEDRAEFEAWLQKNPDALDGRRAPRGPRKPKSKAATAAQPGA